jgi:aspartyl-tRNA(Asn)/glutamyl-tRNA(Gln) amidotransferase subunit C
MIDQKTVHYIAALSRLHIDDGEAEKFAHNLEDILQYVHQLDQLDVSDVKPTSHVLEVENVFREDKVLPSLRRDEAMSFAIEHHDGHYKVPKVIE